MKQPESNTDTAVMEPQDRDDETDRKGFEGEQTSDRETSESPQRPDEAAGNEAVTDPDDNPKPPDEPEKKKRKSIFRRPLFWIFIVVVIAGVIAASLYWWFYKRPFETTDDAFIGADVVQIAPQISGQIVSVPVDSNSHVSKGDLLAHIDPTSPKAQVATARAQLEVARAQLQQAQVGVQQAKDQQAEAESTLDGLKATAQNDKDTYNRDARLAKAASGAITQQQVDSARAKARTSEAQAESGRRSVQTAKTGIKVAEAKVTSAKASVDSAQSQLNMAKVALGHTTISAPLAGQIVQKNINTGSYATQGQPMMALVPDRLYVTANYKETQLSDIRVGQNVDIHVDAYPGIKFHGKVVSVQHGAGQAFQLLPPQNATGNFVKVVQRVPVRISIDADDLQKYALGPGMSVVPSIRVE